MSPQRLLSSINELKYLSKLSVGWFRKVPVNQELNQQIKQTNQHFYDSEPLIIILF